MATALHFPLRPVTATVLHFPLRPGWAILQPAVAPAMAKADCPAGFVRLASEIDSHRFVVGGSLWLPFFAGGFSKFALNDLSHSSIRGVSFGRLLPFGGVDGACFGGCGDLCSGNRYQPWPPPD